MPLDPGPPLRRCVIVCEGRVVARGSNATNATRCAIRHAEWEAVDELRGVRPGKDDFSE